MKEVKKYLDDKIKSNKYFAMEPNIRSSKSNKHNQYRVRHTFDFENVGRFFTSMQKPLLTVNNPNKTQNELQQHLHSKMQKMFMSNGITESTVEQYGIDRVSVGDDGHFFGKVDCILCAFKCRISAKIIEGKCYWTLSNIQRAYTRRYHTISNARKMSPP